MDTIVHVINEMVSYYAGDARRINHFLKVYGFAKTIGELEWLSEQKQQILEMAAVTHDIGIVGCGILDAPFSTRTFVMKGLWFDEKVC